MTTYSTKLKDIERKWFVIDATDMVMGRLASLIAKYLRGKHKTIYTPNIDCGDNIVVINAEKIALTGNQKLKQHIIYWHTGFPGGIKQRTAAEILAGKNPEKLLRKAVERMLDRGPMGSTQLAKLHVYAGATHPHEAQKPEVLDASSLNSKNSIADNKRS
jgi:large subunit ribosomal protein L13